MKKVKNGNSIFLSMDTTSASFDVLVINMRENYLSGRMKNWKCVYYIFSTQVFEWHRMGQRKWIKLS